MTLSVTVSGFELYVCLFAVCVACLNLHFTQTYIHFHISSPAQVLVFFALDGTVHIAVRNLLITETGSKCTNIISDQLLTLCFVFRPRPIALAPLQREQV